MIYLRLIWEFFLIGLFAIGGGFATLPFLYNLAERTGWINPEQIADMVAVAESTPGAIGINMATFTGFTTAGVAGGVCATLGLVLPSIIIIGIIAHCIQRFRSNPWVNYGLSGIRPAAFGLIAAAGAGILRICVWNQDGDGMLNSLDWKAVLLLAAFTWAIMRYKKHPVLYIAAGAILGIAIGL